MMFSAGSAEYTADSASRKRRQVENARPARQRLRDLLRFSLAGAGSEGTG